MLARANSVRLVALSRSDRRVLACCLCGLTALCCAVLGLRSKESGEVHEGSPTNTIRNYGLRRAERWEKMPTMST